jgi:hypothetical protein
MDQHTLLSETGLNVILEADKWARKKAKEIVKSLQD